MVGQGFVERAGDPDPDDGRVVPVSPTPAGREALDAVRREHQALPREHPAGRRDEAVLALAAAVDLIQEVVDALQGDDR